MKVLAKQHGVTLIGAVFLMVLLSSIGASILRISSIQHISSAVSIQSTRAYYAAESGLEWVTAYIRRSGVANTCPPSASPYTLNGFEISIIECTPSGLITEGSQQYTLFRIRVMASTVGASFGDMEYSSRTLESTVVGDITDL